MKKIGELIHIFLRNWKTQNGGEQLINSNLLIDLKIFLYIYKFVVHNMP